MTAELFTIGISHYCEKARWALDWHGIPYAEVGWPPGLHIFLARRAGAPRSSVPILRSGDTVIQGSSAIIDWAEQQGRGDRSLTLTADPEAAAELERRADAVIGVHVRRLVYAQILPRQGHLVRPYLLLNTSPGHRLVGQLTWPVVRRLMISSMDTVPEAAEDSRCHLEAELDHLDALLATGRRYLGGEHFTRIDLTVAALLAPIARPTQAPVYHEMTLPPALERQIEAFNQRPALQWVSDVYRRHRGRGS